MGDAGPNQADKGVGVDDPMQRNWGWVTVATLVMVAWMLFVSATNALDSDDSTAVRTAGSVVFGIAVLAVLAGMWLLRERRATPLAYTLVIVPVLFTGVVFFWLFLLPTTLAVLIVVGVLSGGLGRELRPVSTPQPTR